MTPEERAAAVVANSTGPINITRYACTALEANIAQAIREVVSEERERCARIAETGHLQLPGAITFADCVEHVAATIRGHEEPNEPQCTHPPSWRDGKRCAACEAEGLPLPEVEASVLATFWFAAGGAPNHIVRSLIKEVIERRIAMGVLDQVGG